MAHTEGLVREISKEVLSQYCSYRKKLLFKACFLKHNSFKDFTHPYLTDIHFLFSQTSFASVSPRRNETRKNYSVPENWTWRPKFSGISMNFTSLLSVSRAGEVFVPGDSWTHHHTDCSLPPPHAQKRALSGVPRQSQVRMLHLLEHLALPHLGLWGNPVIQLCIPHHPTCNLPLCRGISSQYRQLSGAEIARAQKARSRV